MIQTGWSRDGNNLNFDALFSLRKASRARVVLVQLGPRFLISLDSSGNEQSLWRKSNVAGMAGAHPDKRFFNHALPNDVPERTDASFKAACLRRSA